MRRSDPPRLRSPSLGVVLAASAGLSAVLALLAAVSLAGVAGADPVFDPGALVRWGTPLVKTASHLAAALTIGALASCAFLIPPGPDRAHPWWRAARLAGAAAGAWTLAQAGLLVLSYLSLTVEPHAGGLIVFAVEHDLGLALAWSVVLTGAVAGLAAPLSSPRGAAGGLLLALAALAPIAALSHRGAADHDIAVSAMLIHLAAVTLWVGPLVVLLAIHPLGSGPSAEVVGRFSSSATVSFALLALSGVLNATVHLQGAGDLLSSDWGRMLLVKATVFAGLGLLGWWNRRIVLRRLRSAVERWAFVRISAVEILLMGAVIGLSVALGSSAPPQPDPDAFAIPRDDAGRTIPPAPSLGALLTESRPEPLFLLGLAAAAICYARWAGRLRRRGEAWPWTRTVAWFAGLALLGWLTNGGLAAYAPLLISAHLAQHMALVAVVGLLLARGGVVSLALRALARRRDGSWGPHEVLVWLLGHRATRFVTHPVVAALHIVIAMAVFYATGVLQLAVTSHLWHVVTTVHIALAGYVFAHVLIGVDPEPRRPPYPVRLALLVPSVVFHALFGLVLVVGDRTFFGDHFVHYAQPWGIDPLVDQQLGGAMTWALGEIPAFVVALAIATMWIEAEERAAERRRRRAHPAARAGRETSRASSVG